MIRPKYEKFKLKKWLEFYTKAHMLSRQLQFGLTSFHAFSESPRMTYNTRKGMERELEQAFLACKAYLDACRMPMPEPLWIYD